MRRISTLPILVVATVLEFASLARAQVLIMGNDIASPNSSDVAIADTRTDIDLVRPATASGSIESAIFTWSAFVCPSAVKIKVFSRHGDALVFRGERGPFDVTGSPTTVSLTPPLVVDEGDLLGIARVANCGNPQTLTGIVSAGYVAYSGDVTGTVSLSGAGAVGTGILNVHATGPATESIARVLPAAGSTPGAGGSFFKTEVQMYNAGGSSVSGRLVYHPAGVVGSSGDPSLQFTIGADATISYSDLVATMGLGGLGTLDVVLPADAQVPVIVARVYNDAGAAGTSGFTEEAIDPAGTSDSRVLFAGATGFMIAPSDTTKYRFNIGIRTLLSGAFITFRVRDSSGTLLATVSKTYDPTFYSQQPAETLLGVPIPANASIEVSVSGGSAIVYGATVDNTTNDPSIQFVRVLFAIA